jgi:HAMP domain-containing protein
LLTLLWLLTGAALALAGAAFFVARRQSKRLERLTESYWELRYEHGQLRARVNRLDPEQPITAPETTPQAGATAFVPLSSLKREALKR